MTTMRTWLEELAGSVGNFGTILPIVFGVALVSEMNLGTILVFFALWYMVMGVYYQIPMSVEPLKVIGAIAIAEGLTAGEVAASGLLMGLIFIGIGWAGGMNAIRDRIPMSVIRGIQAGLALILLRTSAGFIIEDLTFSLIGIGIIFVFLFLNTKKGIPDLSALLIILLGLIIGIGTAGFPGIHPAIAPAIVIPTWEDLIVAAVRLVPPQLPLTLTNAILATSVLAHDLFKRDIDPDRLSKTIGLMNLLSTPFGAFPMCHGAGGLAAHYRFGARTALANIFGGFIILLFALFFSDPATLGLLPAGMFGVLLVFVALELARHGIKTESWLITGTIALMAFFAGMTVAFLWGLFLAAIIRAYTTRREETQKK